MASDDETAAMRARADAWWARGGTPSPWVRYNQGDAIIPRLLAEFASTEVARALADGQEDLTEARDNIARVIARQKEIAAEMEATKKERDNWRDQRVNVGVRFDMYRSDAERRIAALEQRVSDLTRPRSDVGPLASTGMASAGQPVCQAWCGLPLDDNRVPAEGPFQERLDEGLDQLDQPAYCSEPCRDAGRPLNPAPNLSPGLKRDVEPSSIPGRLPEEVQSAEFSAADKCHVCFVHGGGHDQDTHRRLAFVPPADRAALMADTVDARNGQSPIGCCCGPRVTCEHDDFRCCPCAGC